MSLRYEDLREGMTLRCKKRMYDCFACGVIKTVHSVKGKLSLQCDQPGDPMDHNLQGNTINFFEFCEGPW